MRRRHIILCSLALTLALGGCATINGKPTSVIPGAPAPVTVSDKTAEVIAQTQAIAKQVCAFLPTASTVAAIFAAGNPVLSTASGIAEAICAAISNKSSVYGTGGPSVEGVRIKGRRLKG